MAKQSTEIARRQVNVSRTQNATQVTVNRIKKATHEDSIRAVVESIGVHADPNATEQEKRESLSKVCRIVPNSNSMDLARAIDQNIALQDILGQIQQ